MSPRRLATRAGLAVALACAAAAGAAAETRVETFSSSSGIPERFDMALVEVDVSNQAAFGFRRSDLGTRERTSELYLRIEKQKEHAALDRRDRRKGGMNNPLAGIGSLHLGLVGVDLDGTRGNPMAVRAGVYGLGRLSPGTMGITELAYQSGTFGGEPGREQNQAGFHTRFGLRKAVGGSIYLEADYTFSPGTTRDWTPGFKLGMSF